MGFCLPQSLTGMNPVLKWLLLKLTYNCSYLAPQETGRQCIYIVQGEMLFFIIVFMVVEFNRYATQKFKND